MPTRICPAGSYILDAAGFVSLQAVRNAVAHPRCDGLSLYLGGNYGVGRTQPQIVIDSGKCWSPNWERHSDEALRLPGTWVIDSILKSLDFLGVDPAYVPTYISGVDFSTVPSQYPILDRWHQDVCDDADNRDVWIGFYGDVDYGNHLVTQPFWTRTTSRPRPTWSWGGDLMRRITGSTMKQHYGFPSGIDWSSVGVQVDESFTYEPGVYMLAAEADPDPGGQDMPTCITVTGTMKLISPSPKGTHVFAAWVRTEAEANNWESGAYGPCDVQEISQGQCSGIRLQGPCPDNLKGLFHPDSNFSAAAVTPPDLSGYSKVGHVHHSTTTD